MIRYLKNDRFCLGAMVLALLFTVGLLAGCYFSLPQEEAEEAAQKETTQEETAQIKYTTEYTEHIFDDSFVHEIDILLPEVNWDYMLLHALEEQYVLCDVVIDGELFENVAIRPKGNSSLKAIKSQGSDHFSFKIEFDHYQKYKSYYGLDKLALNNLGQDVSCMKDFLTYHMMNEIGIAAPLSSYVHLKRNGEDFGLYLAVEGIEDAFASRNYGDHPGSLYKPECFVIDHVTPSAFLNTDKEQMEQAMQKDYSSYGPGDRAELIGSVLRAPFEGAFGEEMKVAALQYAGEDLERYQIFFDSSVLKQTTEEKRQLVDTLRTLNQGEDPLDAVDIDPVLRFLAVHNFVNNYDSFSSVFVHNYYLREADGKLSFIPWDYNLSLGIYTFQSMTRSYLGADSPYLVKAEVGKAMDDNTSMVNYPIDTPTFSIPLKERPLLHAVLTDDDCLARYHEIYQDFLDAFFDNGRFEELYGRIRKQITPYVQQGQTFYDPESFACAADVVQRYFELRKESIQRQLDGRLPATLEGQSKDYENLVDASDLYLGDTAVFDSLIFGISSDNVKEILDAIAGEHEHSAEGLGQAIDDAAKDNGLILPMILRVLSSSSLIQNGIGNAVKGPLLLFVSVLALLIGRKKVRRYSRRRIRKRKKGREAGGHDAVST